MDPYSVVVVVILVLLVVMIAVVARFSDTSVAVKTTVISLLVLVVGAARLPRRSTEPCTRRPSRSSSGCAMRRCRPVPTGAGNQAVDARDGDVETQPQATLTYTMSGTLRQVCPNVIDAYLHAGWKVTPAATDSRKTSALTSATAFCSRVSPKATKAHFEVSVCPTGHGSDAACVEVYANLDDPRLDPCGPPPQPSTMLSYE